MRRMFATLWTLGSMTVAVPAWSLGETANASRLARQAMDAAQRSAGQTAHFITLQEAPVFVLRVGLSGDRAADGTRVISAPLALNYQPTMTSPWIFGVSGAAYTRVTSPGAPAADGLTDVSLRLIRSLPGSFVAVFGVTVPTGGEVGSTTARQSVALLRTGSLGPGLEYQWLARLQHVNRRDEGLGRTAQLLFGQVDVDVGGDRAAFINAVRWHRRGAGGVTDLGFGYMLPVAESTKATLELTRGITPNARHTRVSLELKRAF